jgi:PAS domain S-box-containing protein
VEPHKLNTERNLEGERSEHALQVALQESEERFQLIFDHSAAGMAITDTSGRFLRANKAYCGLVGYAEDELQLITVLHLTHPEDRQASEAWFSQKPTGLRQTLELEKRYVRKDGEIIWVQVNAVYIASGGRPCYCAVIQDITARKRSEEALRCREEHFRNFANDTPAYLWMTSVDDENLFINNRLAAFLGTSQNTLAPGWTFVHPRDRTRVKERSLACFTAGCDYLDEYRARRSDGEYRWVVSTAIPRRSPAGSLLGYAGSLADITDRKLAEDSLKVANDLLTEELIERKQAEQEILALSEALINTQEEERRRIARELHDDLSQQVAALSISISNLIRRIPASDSDARDQSQRLHQRISGLAESIRHLSHDLHSPVLEHSGIAAALRSYCAEFTSLSHVTVSVSAEEAFDDLSPATALCMYRITQEALRNVAKHSGASQAEVRLARSKECVRLMISDAGTGFSPDRAVGLGLVSMKERARLVNGTFHIDSEINRGTTLTVSIPT